MTAPVRLQDCVAVILAGGLGTRLRAVVADRPKSMAMVAGRPFLDHLLARLEAAGVHRTVLCIGHRGEQVRTHFGSAYGRMELAYAVERDLLGTGGALRNALAYLDRPTVLAMNGDSWCDADLGTFADWHAAWAADISLLLTQVPDRGRYGGVEAGADGRVVAFLEKQADAGAGAINAGVYLFRRAVIERLPPDEVISLERDVFPLQIGRGLFGWPGGGRFIDIGTAASYAEADTFFAAGRGTPERAIEAVG